MFQFKEKVIEEGKVYKDKFNGRVVLSEENAFDINVYFCSIDLNTLEPFYSECFRYDLMQDEFAIEYLSCLIEERVNYV